MSVTSLVRGDTVRIPLNAIQEKVVLLRTEYKEDPLSELSDSLTGEGLLQPIIVAPCGDSMYELIIGSRRVRSAKKAGCKDIPALVVEEQSPLNYLLMALAENLHREDLTPFEEAHAFLRLMKDYGLGVQETAKKVGKTESYVRTRMELLSMPEGVQSLIAEKGLGLQFVGLLAQLPSGEDQFHYAAKAVNERLTIKELRSVITQDAVLPSEKAVRGSRMSAEKVRVKILTVVEWLKKVPKKTVIKQMNTDERAAIAAALHEMDVELRTLRNLFLLKGSDSSSGDSFREGNFQEDPRNHNAEWSSRDIEAITNSDRPSDESLSKQLGRSVAAIRSMRAKAAEPKKTA
tara:strand:+ start:13935 stop:14975 length:1041 start_codon:yes stop_codon:yes gene_type:complete